MDSTDSAIMRLIMLSLRGVDDHVSTWKNNGNEPVHEKTNNLVFQPGLTQTRPDQPVQSQKQARSLKFPI